jgi:3-deoxy-D-manno-octulosonic acid kinase
MNFAQHKSENVIYYFDQQIIDRIEGFFVAAQEDVSQTLKRGGKSVFKHNDSNLIFKHYHRGGLVSKFSDDKYLWLGEGRVRAFQEFQLLKLLKEIGLPAPTPVAARAVRCGIFYQCDLVTKEIAGSKTLSNILLEKKLLSEEWENIGLCVREFHDNNIYHADLNATNILLDSNRNIYLIDFDKSEIRKDSEVWKQEVLARLRRSLTKFKKHNQSFSFTDQDWSYLINAYMGHKSV